MIEPQFSAYFPDMPKLRSHLSWILELQSDCLKDGLKIAKMNVRSEDLPLIDLRITPEDPNSPMLLFGIPIEIGEFDFELEKI